MTRGVTGVTGMTRRPALLVALSVLLLATAVLAQGFLDSPAFAELDEPARQAISLAVATPKVQAFLAQYPFWSAEAYADDEDYWHVDFYDRGELVGYTHVYLDSGALNPDDTRLPERLSDEQRANLEAELKRAAFHDPEVAALTGDPEAWEYDFGYDLYSDGWSMYLWRGLERLTVEFYRDGERFTVARFYDPSAFDEAEARRVARDQAFALAYGAPGIDAALAGYDDWRAYAEEQGEGRWSVEFAAGGERLITVLVDVARGQILGVETP